MRVLGLDKPHPSRTTGSEHGVPLQLPRRKSLYKLVGFLHDRKVRGEYCVKYIVRSHSLQSVHDLSNGSLLRRKSGLLSPGSADSRRHLDHYGLLLICQGIPHLLCVVPLTQGSHRAVGDALSAQGAGSILDIHVPRHIDCGPRAGSLHIPDRQLLHLVADLDTAHAFDTLCRIADQREVHVPLSPVYLLPVGKIDNIQIIGHLLQAAVAAAGTGDALAVVLGEDQLHIGPPVLAHFRAVGKDDHALFRHIVAGCDQALLSLQFHHTDAAGRDLIDPFQKTEAGDGNAVLSCRFHDRCIFFYGNTLSVNRQIYHILSRPPLNIP